MPRLKIFDIPGFADTKGTESDQKQWEDTVTQLRNQTGEDLLLETSVQLVSFFCWPFVDLCKGL
jgi:hypothetical protein